MVNKIRNLLFVSTAFFLVGCQVTSDGENGAEETELTENETDDNHTGAAEDNVSDFTDEFQELFESGEMEESLFSFQSQGTYLDSQEPLIGLEDLSDLEGKYLFLASSINSDEDGGIDDEDLGVPVSYDFSTDTEQSSIEVVYLSSELSGEGAMVTGEQEYTRVEHTVESIEETDEGYVVLTDGETFEFEEHGSTQLRDSYDNLFQIYDTSIEEILEAYSTQFD